MSAVSVLISEAEQCPIVKKLLQNHKSYEIPRYMRGFWCQVADEISQESVCMSDVGAKRPSAIIETSMTRQPRSRLQKSLRRREAEILGPKRCLPAV